MYQVEFAATTSADWSQAVELIDADTNLPLSGIDDATFALAVNDHCGSAILSASTDKGTLDQPVPNIVQWTFTKAQMGAACRAHTYKVGLTMTTAGGTIQLLVGTLAVTDGVVR